MILYFFVCFGVIDYTLQVRTSRPVSSFHLVTIFGTSRKCRIELTNLVELTMETINFYFLPSVNC